MTNAPNGLTPSLVALDPAVLDQLRELETAADPGIAARVLGLYRDEAPKTMATIASAVVAADAAEIARAAHSLKSSSASIGATVMSVLCAELVAAGRGGKVLNAREIFVRVEAEQVRVQEAIGIELARWAKA